MTDETAIQCATAEPARGRRIGPILTLLILSPMVGEVLSGATRLSFGPFLSKQDVHFATDALAEVSMKSAIA